jgi:ATP-dependent phosphoenolpyruvate carboxykinase
VPTHDDQHVLSDTGVFNIEGGCYAKTIKEGAWDYAAIPFGSILENVIYSPTTRAPDYDESMMENMGVLTQSSSFRMHIYRALSTGSLAISLCLHARRLVCSLL